MNYHFFAYLSRMRQIRRWGLMRNTQPENDLEHTCMVAMIAHALSEIRNQRYGGSLDVSKVLKLALYHEAPEVITGDMPSPVKYGSAPLTESFKKIEKEASRLLLTYLPEDLKPVYEPLLLQDEESEEWCVVKAADKISAYIKCAEECYANNVEFEMAYKKIKAQVEAIELPEVKDFLSQFSGSFMLSIDALNC